MTPNLTGTIRGGLLETKQKNNKQSRIMQSCTHTYSKRRRQKALGVEKRMPATSGTPEGRCRQSWSAALCIQLVEGDVCRETRHPFLLIKVRPNGNQNFPKGEFHFFKFSYVMLITEDPKYQEASWQKTT